VRPGQDVEAARYARDGRGTVAHLKVTMGKNTLRCALTIPPAKALVFEVPDHRALAHVGCLCRELAALVRP
jgi:hypothetical protein